ncbi:MAG: hypothetical protein R2825_22970 [Saprospiraceae bacterium]
MDKSYTFPNPANPFEEVFPEVYNINNFTGNNQTPNFVAIKIGDLNNTATGNLQAAADDRNAASELVFQTAEKSVKTGESFTIEITADLADIMAYQFTMGFDKENSNWKPSSLEWI